MSGHLLHEQPVVVIDDVVAVPKSQQVHGPWTVHLVEEAPSGACPPSAGR
ncbi:hypothetical protein ACFYNZ_01845 [Streptomyces kebangsaanensis]|uniref:Transposase n=1 Tax=Streptomyces kebangsaanensis TaxID=864058 RepID=A0ABW6KK48_9ACTN